MLVRLLYASRCDKVSPEMIEAILARARERNPAQGITGILCHGGSVFMQVLEGGREAVNQLYNAIARDPRHHSVTLLHYEEISERMFVGWTMGQVNLGRINASMLLKYGERAVLDPYCVTGQASMALLQELIASAAIVGRTG
ncbi:MAG: BLUF domain-containing protein [Leptothrix sp. (in: b-proteobacteria)]